MRSGWLLRDGDVVCALDLADSPAERGALRGRPGCEGALHVDGARTVHTAGMKFPIDVAFLSVDLTVVRVARLKPWRVAVGGRTARSAVQTEAGSLERWGVRVGDQLEVRVVPNGDEWCRKRHAVSDERRGQLVLVATPIGNLGDLSPRAREVLATADLICCEDTRRTRALLSASGITAKGPHGDRLLSLHGHNEASRLDRVATAVAGGATVAVVSDAGTPGISDPGAWLAAQLAAAGATVSTVPGPSSVLGALVVSGLPADRFCVEGFLPRKGPERRRRLGALMADARTTVVLEAPNRVAATLAELAATDEARPVAVVRELTKLHEEVWRGTLGEAATVFAAREIRGEVVLVVGGAPAAAPAAEDDVEAAVRAALGDDPSAGPRQVAELVAASLGVPRRRAYEAALRVRGGTGGEGDTAGPA